MNKLSHQAEIDALFEPVDTTDMEMGLQLLDMQEHILNNRTSIEAVYRVLLAHNLTTEEEFQKLRERLRTEVEDYAKQYQSIQTQRDLLKSSIDMVNLLNKGASDEGSLSEEEKAKFDRLVSEAEEAESMEDILKMMSPEYAAQKENKN